MPLYDYRCRSCGAGFDAQRAAGEPPPPCPRCGAPDADRVFTPFAGPFTIRPRGWRARKLEGERRAREQQRAERRAEGGSGGSQG
jgi:putative FmdB family regulatory protein